MSLFTLTHAEAFSIADQAIGLFLEFRDQHGQTEEESRASACQEIVDGLSVTDAELQP